MGENGGKWGEMGENGGKWRKMGGNGKLLKIHHGKCMKIFQQERKMEENGVEMGGKWVKNGTRTGPIFPIFPKGNLLPHRAVNTKPSIQVSGWENGENGSIRRYPENWILLRLVAGDRRGAHVFARSSTVCPMITCQQSSGPPAHIRFLTHVSTHTLRAPDPRVKLVLPGSTAGAHVGTWNWGARRPPALCRSSALSVHWSTLPSFPFAFSAPPSPTPVQQDALECFGWAFTTARAFVWPREASPCRSPVAELPVGM